MVIANRGRKPRYRGFALMDKETQRTVASKGGKAAHAVGRAHTFTSKEATLAGQKSHELGNAHEFTSKEARLAGRKGSLVRAQNRARAKQTL